MTICNNNFIKFHWIATTFPIICSLIKNVDVFKSVFSFHLFISLPTEPKRLQAILFFNIFSFFFWGEICVFRYFIFLLLEINWHQVTNLLLYAPITVCSVVLSCLLWIALLLLGNIKLHALPFLIWIYTCRDRAITASCKLQHLINIPIELWGEFFVLAQKSKPISIPKRIVSRIEKRTMKKKKWFVNKNSFGRKSKWRKVLSLSIY